MANVNKIFAYSELASARGASHFITILTILVDKFIGPFYMAVGRPIIFDQSER